MLPPSPLMRWVEAGGDLGNVVGRGGKKILPPSAEHLGVKKTRWTRMLDVVYCFFTP